MNLDTKTETKQFKASNPDNLVAERVVSIDNKLARPPSPKRFDKLEVPQNLISLDDDLKEKKEGEFNGVEGLVEDEVYKFVTSDNVIFELDKNAISLSKLASVMISVDKNEKTLPISNIHSSTMKHIVKYLKYHALNPVPENNTPVKLISNVFSKNIICEWDIKLIDEDVMYDKKTAKNNLYSLIRACNYMDIQPLLHLTCAKVACMIKGESIDAIKNIISTYVPYEDNHTE